MQKLLQLIKIREDTKILRSQAAEEFQKRKKKLTAFPLILIVFVDVNTNEKELIREG